MSYLDVRHPEQADVKDAVADEPRQVKRQEVKVQTYDTEKKQVQYTALVLNNHITENVYLKICLLFHTV